MSPTHPLIPLIPLMSPTSPTAGRYELVLSACAALLEYAWQTLAMSLSDRERLPLSLTLILAASAVVIEVGLIIKQSEAHKKDEAAVEKLRALMKARRTHHRRPDLDPSACG